MTPQSGTRVREAMLNVVKVLPATATVEDVERFFDDDHVHLAVLVDGNVVVSSLTRQDLTSSGSTAATPAREVGTLSDRTVAPDDAVELVHRQMLRRGQRRVVVVDTNLGLRGLLCMKRSSRGFCADADVRDRASAAASAEERECGWSRPGYVGVPSQERRPIMTSSPETPAPEPDEAPDGEEIPMPLEPSVTNPDADGEDIAANEP